MRAALVQNREAPGRASGAMEVRLPAAIVRSSLVLAMLKLVRVYTG